MSSYTPGPWYICDGPTCYQHRVYWQQNEVAGGTICDVVLNQDARLIQSAPDLLDALKRLVANGDIRDAAHKGEISQARAAIAKATGK